MTTERAISDLTPEQVAIYRRMTPERKLQLAGALYRDARLLKASALRAFHPDWSDLQVEAETRRIFMYARS